MRHRVCCLVVATAVSAAPALAAQTAPPGSSTSAGSSSPATPGELAEGEEVEPASGDIVVVATRVRGQVDAPQPPIQVLDEGDIAAYGSASLSDLLEQLGPQAGSGRGRGSGRPVVLLNGQRVSGFREMRNIPPEAIRRLEILPEDVALRYGYPADQRVINFILKDRFAATTLEMEYGLPDRGGTATLEGEASLFRTAGQSRLNLALKAEDTTPLFESERNVVQVDGSLPGSAAARTLVADSRELGANATWTKGLGEKGLDGSLALNGAFTRTDSTSFSGLDVLTFDPLARRSRTETAEAGIVFARGLGDWQLTATADASHAAALTRIDLRESLSGAVDTAHSINDTATGLVTLVGRPVSLPAGEVTATFKAGFAHTGIISRDSRAGTDEIRLRRGDASLGVNLGLPIASRRNGVLAGIGDLAINLSAGFNHLSDFGTLTDWSAGLTWGVTEALGFQASYIVNQAAPGLTDLGNPQVETFNVPIYDFERRETALVTVTSGGNPFLARETRRDLKLGANWRLPFLANSNLVVEYFRNTSTNVTAAFPLLTPAIEAAFPGRVRRGTDGRIEALDRRPVTFARESGSRLRYGLNLSGRLGRPTPPPSRTAERPSRQEAAPAGTGAGSGGFGRARGGNGQGRWRLSLYHTVRFHDRVTVAAGSPVLDLLGGDGIGTGGLARHSLEFEGGTFYRGFGLRLNGSWAAPTRVRSAAGAGQDLRFGALTKVNARVFVDLGQQQSLVREHPFFKGARLSLKVENLLDSRQRVTDGTGAVPLGYQPDLLDPLGRVVAVELRKQF